MVFLATNPNTPPDRRGSERSRITCPAQLNLTSGLRVGALWDLSETGARMQMAEPPRPGAEALLRWQEYEAFCSVVWVHDDMCGLVFHRPLAPGMLDGTIGEEIARTGPAAQVRNIPLGRKRTRL